MNFNLLIVDDEVLIRELVSELTRSFIGDQGGVFEAGTGKEAIEILEREVIDIVITDIKMPEMSGTELLEKMSSYIFRVPVIMVTGHGSRDLAIEVFKKGAFDFVEKPFGTQKIEEVVRRAMEFRRKVRLQDELFLKHLKMSAGIERIESFFALPDEEQNKIMDSIYSKI